MAADLVIRNGLLVDGTGSPCVRADVAITGDRISEIGNHIGRGKREIDAAGRIVTPGFVDIHTHLDAQFGWDPLGTSACWHGVTSVVMGNCGVTFAPVRDGDAAYLASMMESVEDIPARSILDGLPWDWETYGQYLDWLERTPTGVNVGGMVGHSALRYYAMGERSLNENIDPTQDELATMTRLLDEAMNAGALGCSSSRTLRHRVPDGRYVPGTFARVEELLALAEVLAKKPGGIFEVAPRFDGDGPAEPRVETELAWMEQVSQVSQSPLTFNLTHTWEQGEHWRTALDLTRAANSRGARIRPQTVARFVGVLTGLMHRTPFDAHASWYALRGLSLEEKLAVLNNTDRKTELVNEAKNDRRGLDNFFLLNGPNNQALYECRPEQSLIAIADQRKVTPVEAFIDLAQATDGKLLLSWPLLNQSRDAIEEMIKTPEVLMGLADTGAHVGQTMDASAPTYLLSHWARDRKSITLEEAVRKITSDTAQTFGLANRGVLALGAYADVNVINYEELSLLVPEYRHDFPHNAGRFAQKANGYEVTIVNGEVFMEHGEHTGALAGTVLRSV